MRKKTALPLGFSASPTFSKTMPIIVCLVILVSQSCSDDGPVSKPHVSPQMVNSWNIQIEKAYTFSLEDGLPPPIISRLFAMYHVAMHDALNSIDPIYSTYASKTVDKDADPNAAVAQAVYDVLDQIGPQDGAAKVSIDSLFTTSMLSISDGIAKDKGIALGKSVAQAVLAKRLGDVPFLQVVGYSPTPASGTTAGKYKHLPPLNYALAGFHLMTPWVMTSAKQFPVIAPHSINGFEYAADYDEVKNFGEANSTARTTDQKTLGIFWAENSSRGWNSVARAVIKIAGTNMDAWETARLLALMHIAIADGYISVFDSKMQHYYWRPISAIHEGEDDGNPDTEGDPTWEATLVTPPTGEYPSAHALTGAAAGEVLIKYFGKSNIPFSTTSGYLPGTRSFANIGAAVRENSLSRIYIGYHFRNAVDVGEATGYLIGDYVFQNALSKK